MEPTCAHEHHNRPGVSQCYALVDVPRRGQCIRLTQRFNHPNGDGAVAFYYQDAPADLPADAPQATLEAAYQAMKGRDNG